MIDLSKSSHHAFYTTERIERQWTVDFYTQITVITHGGRIIKVTISRPGMSLDFSCPEGDSNIFDQAIQYLVAVKHEIPPELEYTKAKDDVPA